MFLACTHQPRWPVGYRDELGVVGGLVVVAALLEAWPRLSKTLRPERTGAGGYPVRTLEG